MWPKHFPAKGKARVFKQAATLSPLSAYYIVIPSLFHVLPTGYSAITFDVQSIVALSFQSCLVLLPGQLSLGVSAASLFHNPFSLRTGELHLFWHLLCIVGHSDDPMQVASLCNAGSQSLQCVTLPLSFPASLHPLQTAPSPRDLHPHSCVHDPACLPRLIRPASKSPRDCKIWKGRKSAEHQYPGFLLPGCAIFDKLLSLASRL